MEIAPQRLPLAKPVADPLSKPEPKFNLPKPQLVPNPRLPPIRPPKVSTTKNPGKSPRTKMPFGMIVPILTPRKISHIPEQLVG